MSTSPTSVKSNKNNILIISLILIVLLVCICVVVVIISAITFIAIDPSKNFADTRNAQRSSDVTQILNAVTQYTSESGNSLYDLGVIPFCPTQGKIGSGSGKIDLSSHLVDSYIISIPTDPLVGTDSDTLYTICQTSGSRIQVSAPQAERGKVITVQR